VCATSVSAGDQGSVPTLGQWPQSYRVWYEIDIFKLSVKKFNYASNHQCQLILFYNYYNIKVNFFCFVFFMKF